MRLRFKVIDVKNEVTVVRLPHLMVFLCHRNSIFTQIFLSFLDTFPYWKCNCFYLRIKTVSCLDLIPLTEYIKYYCNNEDTIKRSKMKSYKPRLKHVLDFQQAFLQDKCALLSKKKYEIFSCGLTGLSVITLISGFRFLSVMPVIFDRWISNS